MLRPFFRWKEKLKRKAELRGLVKNPLFYFGLASFILLISIYININSIDINNLDNPINIRAIFFNSFFNENYTNKIASANTLFSSQISVASLETPDLKTIQNNTLCAVSVPCTVSGKVLGAAFGGNSQNKKDIIDYIVQPGDTQQSIAEADNISVDTLRWANDLTSSSILKVGQSLTILPINGVLHIVKAGDTLSALAQTYKAQVDDIIFYNDLINQNDIYVGDVLIIPNGVMPKKPIPSVANNNYIPVVDGFFILPTQGRITQGLHYYNAIDVANQCGTAVYAAAPGVVKRAVFNNAWNSGMGNYITILHSNGIVTYYGHLESVFVKSGDTVSVGERIGLIGRTGKATGCHLHFQVVGAQNPLAKYPVGSTLNYK